MIKPIALTVRAQWVALLIVFAIVAVSAYLFGVKTSAPPPEVITPAAAQSQTDGSVVAERRPVAGKPPAAPHVLPKGSTEERRVSVTVKPSAQIKLPSTNVSESSQWSGECPPVTVDLSLVRQGDGRRVVASSPDGEVVGAVDIPIEAGVIPVSRPWAAGLSCDPGKCQQTAGAWIERDLGRVRVGAEAARQQDGAMQGRVRVGWVW